MTDQMLLLTGLWGVFLILSIARVGVALVLDRRLRGPLGWVVTALFAGFYLEATIPAGASFDAVMQGLIYLVSHVL